MKHSGMKYGPVKGYADGGKVELYKSKKAKLKPHKPGKVKDPITRKDVPPGGSQTPGAKGTYPMPKEKKRR